jgi:hypothetical protein
MTPKSEEEIESSVKADVKRMLNDAEKGPYGRSRIGYFGPEAFKYIQEYVLADGLFDPEICYLLYNGIVYKMTSIPGGDYYTMVTKIPESTEELKVKLKDILNKLG